MSVQLVMTQGIIPKYSAVWTNVAQHLDWNKIKWLNFPERYQRVDQMLSPYNGRILRGNPTGVVFEFDSQEDLTHFVLTWS